MSFLIPYRYGFATRAPKPYDKCSFFAIFVFPLAFVCAQGQPTPFHRGDVIAFAVRFFLGITAQYALYEIGYLCNDVYTTRREACPTIRMPKEVHARVCRYVPLLIAARVATFAICFVLLTLFPFNPIPFLGGLTMLSICFALHNAVRGTANAATYLFLCTLKYACLPLLFLPDTSIPSAVATLFFAFVLPRSIEHASKPKYKLFRLPADKHDAFRVLYYTALSTVLLLPVPIPADRLPALLPLSLWFLAFRSAAYGLRRHTRRRAKGNALF